MSDREYTNEDFLSALREAQDSARPQGPGNFAEWRQERPYAKAQGGYSPGFGLMGHMNTSSRAPTGPNGRLSGNNAVGLKQWPQQFGVPSGTAAQQGRSKYADMRPNQPSPWIDDVDMASLWYSPMEPVWPFGPPYYDVPREWNFPVGYNLNYVPQRLELMGMLRGMRQSWGILSTIIETRKDQLLRIPWTIQVRNKPRATSKYVDEIRRFFKRPDGKLSYSQWSRKYLDDLLVIDAPTIYLNRDMGGKVRQAEVLDGGTIFPLIDDVGRRPDSIVDVGPNGVTYERRQPAFQQIIYGLPMVNLSEDEIIYGMMRPRPELPVFGYSPVEQILTEATEAIRKTAYQLEFWRSGSMPELIVTVPDNWNPRQIATFQAHFDAVLSGQLTLKSKVRFVPGGMKPFDIKNASGESLWSQRDELLVRLACYAYSVSPTPFVHQTNRACYSADTETLTENGWKTLDQLRYGERVATVNPLTGNLEYHKPNKFLLYDVANEQLVRFLGDKVDVLVTKEHEMWLRVNSNKDSYKKVRAAEVHGKAFAFKATVNYEGGEDPDEFVLPSVDRWVGTAREDETGIKNISIEFWLKLLGFYISEGGMSSDYHQFTLAQNKSKEDGNVVHSIRSTLKEIGVGFSEYPEGDNLIRWTVANKQLCDWLKEHVGIYSYEKRIPREFMCLAKKHLAVLFTALMRGDGSWDTREGRTNGYYSTTSLDLANDVQELAFLLGYCTVKSVHYEAHGNRRKCYRVLISERDESWLSAEADSRRHCNVHLEEYSGQVYCFDVPNHLFVTRRNGKIGIHGNTANQAQESANEEGLYPLMSYWKDDVADTIIQEKFGYDDIEFVYLPRAEPDQTKQASIHQIRIDEGLQTRNEVREELGLEPVEDGDYLTVKSGAAVVRLDQIISGEAIMPGAPSPPENPTPAAPTGRSVAPVRGAAKPRSANTTPPTPIHKRLSAKDIAHAADKADRHPSAIKRKIGNYPKGHLSLRGLSISIENAKGSKRREKDQFGRSIKTKMPTAYGYIRGTVGADGMQVDCYLGKYPDSNTVWVIDQDKFDVNGEDKGFDEHKVMLAYSTFKKAVKDYLASHFDGLGYDRLSAATQLSYDELKSWLKHGNMKTPISEQGYGHVIARRGVGSGIAKGDTISQSSGLLSYDQTLASPRRSRKKAKRKMRRDSGPKWLALSA